MCDASLIYQLYSNVLYEHQIKYKVKDAAIRTAIRNMTEVYKPNPNSLSAQAFWVADYNDAAHRCAYLHKYAPFHTALVAEMLFMALEQNFKVFHDVIYPSGQINICSLGGGPGSDIFGVLSILSANFDLFQVSATVIDCMENWQDMFYDLITQLRYGNYGALGESVEEQYFDWKYLQHNLIGSMTNQVNQAIGSADLVTMIKFVSASSCKDTSAMIKKIFRTMKPGGLVLYIDNAGGGFHQAVRKEAQEFNFITIFGPLKHTTYRNENFNTKRFGYTPCLETKVTVQIWRKASPNMNESAEMNVFPGVDDPNYNFNAGHGGARRQFRRQSPARSRPRRQRRRRDQMEDHLVRDENEDCGTCCVIS